MTRTGARVTVGLDIGGAHLKAARLEDGKPVAVEIYPSPLWHGLARLDEAFASASQLMAGADSYAVTTTGELSRIFESRAEGVMALLDKVAQTVGSPEMVKVWMGSRGFGSIGAAKRLPIAVASANFLAPAIYAASVIDNGLFVDMGSTTTDIIGLSSGDVTCVDTSDASRLSRGELIYTGLTRTSIMAVTQRIPVGGVWRATANETFADMGDVNRLLGLLPEDADIEPTADQRSRSTDDTLRRLGMVAGDDAENSNFSRWFGVAKYIASAQHRQILDGMHQVLSAFDWQPGCTVVTAGIGAPLITMIVGQIGLKSCSFAEICSAPEKLALDVTRHAPAVAVAMLSDTLDDNTDA